MWGGGDYHMPPDILSRIPRNKFTVTSRIGRTQCATGYWGGKLENSVVLNATQLQIYYFWSKFSPAKKDKRIKCTRRRRFTRPPHPPLPELENDALPPSFFLSKVPANANFSDEDKRRRKLQQCLRSQRRVIASECKMWYHLSVHYKYWMQRRFKGGARALMKTGI